MERNKIYTKFQGISWTKLTKFHISGYTLGHKKIQDISRTSGICQFPGCVDTLLSELDITATGVIKDWVVIIEFLVFLDSSLQMLAQARWIELSVAFLQSFTWWLNSTSWSILVSSNFSYLLMLATITPTSTLFWTVLSDPQVFAALQRWL